MPRTAFALVLVAATALGAAGQPAPNKPRARELGIAALLGGTPGALDAITDVPGVEVGHATVIHGSGARQRGIGPARTGVTVVHPRGQQANDPVFAAWFTLNGNGELTGTTWVQESGFLEGPIAITNTNSVGVVRDAIVEWQVTRPGLQPWGLPVVGETWDGVLNDIDGFHVKPAHAMTALDSATAGPVAEGNVGGGTGMVCHRFKGGIGTASRVVEVAGARYTLGVLVQCNYGRRPDFRVAGVPVGEAIPDLLPCTAGGAKSSGMPEATACDAAPSPAPGGEDTGSIIAVVATDAPLLPHQLKRIATRVSLGIGRMGGMGANSSGDIFLAFSTANPGAALADKAMPVQMIPNGEINPLFHATVQATEEAILNALLAAETMEGADGMRVHALPHDRLLAALKDAGRLE